MPLACPPAVAEKEPLARHLRGLLQTTPKCTIQMSRMHSCTRCARAAGAPAQAQPAASTLAAAAADQRTTGLLDHV
jgi:hypothetical protein